MAGFGIFQRLGEVQGRQLAEGRSWTTEHGDRLVANAGDWWVWTTSPSRGRSVGPQAFARTYHLIADDRYERVGTVTARQAQTREPVVTDEGVSYAEPGDWIVSEGGATWPVPESQFLRTYTPLE